MWAQPCAHVIFDTDPTPRGRGGPAEDEEMSQAMIRWRLFSSFEILHHDKFAVIAVL